MFVNAMIGLLLVGVAFLIFMFIQSKISSLGNQSVSDAQYVDVVSSYAGVYSKIGKEDFLLINSVAVDMKDDDFLFFGHDKAIVGYSQFRGDLTSTVDLKDVSFKNALFNYYDSELKSYSGFSELNLKTEALPCPVNKMKHTRCDNMNDCVFEANYCSFMEVLS